MRFRFSRLALGILILAGTPLAAVRASGRFTPFLPHALPQGAPGDFDGDGRQDLALIQNGIHGSHISVTLSGSSSTVSLDGSAVTLVVIDIDRDGDLDLVAVAPSGQVMAWLNDGRGRFTKQEAPRPYRLSSQTVVFDPLVDQPVAVGATAPSVVEFRTRNAPVAVTLVPSLSAPLVFDLGCLAHPGLRAPPLPVSLS